MFSALALLAVAAPTAAPIQWVHDDWAAAKRQAKADGKLVAVDVWATWCHTCLSMKNFTLKETPLGRVASTHTWLALDYDLPANAEFFKKFPISAFPTFMVVDPSNDEVVARWLGSGTADQMATFFAGATKNGTDVIARGQRALSKGDYASAVAIFEEALVKKQNTTERTRILSGYVEAMWKHDPKRCATEGLRYIDQTDDTAPGVDYAMMIAYCAEDLAGDEKKAVLRKIRDRLERAASNPALPLSADDQSSLYSTLADLHEALGDADKAKAVVQKRVAVLEKAAASAKTAEARTTFDAHRMSCYLKLKRYDDAEKMLKASLAAMPKDFNHPWRLATLYLKTNRIDEGLKVIDQGLAVGYGARKLRLYSTKIDLLLAANNKGEARKTYAAAQTELKGIDPKLVRKFWLAELEGKLAKIDAGS